MAQAMLIAAVATMAVGQIVQGRNAARMAEMEAAFAESEAQRVREAAGFEERRLRSEADDLSAAQRMGFLASGVELEGTPLLVLADTREEVELDAMALRSTASASEARAMASGAISRQRGRAAQISGYFNAGSTLLSGGYKLSTLGPGGPAVPASAPGAPATTTPATGGTTYGVGSLY